MTNALSKIGRALSAPSSAGLFSLQIGVDSDRIVRPVFQKRHQQLDGLQSVKNVTATRNLWHGQGLPGPQAAARVGNRRLGLKAPILKFQQAKPPRVAVALVLQAQQIAVGGSDVGPNQHRPPTLKNLVVCADANRVQRLLLIVLAGLGHGTLKHLVNFADGNRIVEEVAAQFADPTDGTMTDQRQPEDELFDPILGHGEVKKNLIGASFLLEEYFVKGIVGPIPLPIDELAADFVFGGQSADGRGSHQSMQS